MDLPVITVAPEQARAKLRAYRQAVRETRRRDDRLMAHAFYQASRGKQIVSLSAAIEAGGTIETEVERTVWESVRYVRRRCTVAVPRLAVARALTNLVYLRVTGEAVEFHDGHDKARWHVANVGEHHAMVRWVLPAVDLAWNRPLSARVPPIPPEVRPRGHRSAVANLANYHVLWEAEWRQERAPVPRDPALLKHIGGDLFVVMATWDLTDLERAVLASLR